MHISTLTFRNTKDMCCCHQDVGEEPYKANVMKITGNFFIVSCIETIAEAMTLAEKNGIPRQAERAQAAKFHVPMSSSEAVALWLLQGHNSTVCVKHISWPNLSRVC